MLPLLLLLHGLVQDAPTVGASVPAANTGISVRLERRAERFDYHFDNESNIEEGPPVPHFFEQRYDADNTWLMVAADYRLTGARATTEVGFTPTVTRAGSDIDTFFQPSGDVITSGTRGDVRIQSLSIRQRIAMTSWRAVSLGVVIGYRRSEMDFLPSDRIVTHSQPPSESREPVPGHETTWSHVVASGVSATIPARVSERWQAVVSVDAVPLTRSRLNISLPDKYPDQVIRAAALGFGTHGRVVIEHRSPRVAAGVGVSGGGTWGYTSTSHYHDRRVGGDLYVRITLQ